jgi:hypothetical protein
MMETRHIKQVLEIKTTPLKLFHHLQAKLAMTRIPSIHLTQTLAVNQFHVDRRPL